jgi:hypothetical protein
MDFLETVDEEFGEAHRVLSWIYKPTNAVQLYALQFEVSNDYAGHDEDVTFTNPELIKFLCFDACDSKDFEEWNMIKYPEYFQ